MNGDGKLDLVDVGGDENEGGVFFGDGAGHFAYSSFIGFRDQDDSDDSGAESLIVGDFNGDGSPDIMALESYDGSRAILTNDGTGHFGTPSVEDDVDYNVGQLFSPLRHARASTWPPAISMATASPT